MQNTRLLIVLLLTTHHTNWTMEATPSSNDLLIKNAFAPSGLTLKQDEEKINQLCAQIPKKIDAHTNFHGLNSTIIQAQAALIHYLHNPAIDPKLAKPDIAIKRFSAGFRLASLALQEERVKYLLSPEGQQKLQEYKQQQEFRQSMINVGTGLAAVGAITFCYFSNL